MRIFSDLTEFETEECRGCAVVIGKFDGLHAGHQRLLDTVAERRSGGLKTLVVTFDRPLSDFFSGTAGRVLTTDEERDRLLSEREVDYEYVMPVTKETMAVSPEDFLKLLAGRLRARVIAAGRDLSFGAGGKGDFPLLSRLSAELGYEAVPVEKVRYAGEEISSSRIREAVAAGRIEEAEAMLGRPYSLEGTVSEGKRLGRRLGMPTLNLIPAEQKLLPPFGVYVSETRLLGRTFMGVTNVGVKPTVSDERRPVAETCLFDFDEVVYGERVTVSLLAFLRPERRFADTEELKNQMRQDLLQGKSYGRRIAGSVHG